MLIYQNISGINKFLDMQLQPLKIYKDYLIRKEPL